jgi:putative ATP-dependent endonuclease of OLD family
MHVSEFTLQNITSYRDRTCFSLGPELNIVIGPNGGGKTNAIQCLWIALEKFFFQHYKVEDKPEGRQITTKDILSQRYNRYLEKHDESQDSYVEIALIPERSDAANIRSIQRAIDQINSEYKLLQFARVSDITEAHLHAFDHGSPLHFTVKNGALLQPPAETPESAFLLYCKAIDLVTRYATFDPSFDVTVPIFFLQSVRQASAGYDVNVGGLNPQGYYEARQGVIVSAGGGLSGLASQHFGRIKLKAIKAASKREGGPSEIQIFNADPEVRLLRKYLELLGYEWDLVERSLDSWNYIAKFKKDGRDVDPNKFSSGEREIFNFLYGIIPTNVKSGVVIIDEPELHLHPKWQGIFLSLFQEFARERGLQFVLSTHSPAFVTHRTIDAVTGSFKEMVSAAAQPFGQKRYQTERNWSGWSIVTTTSDCFSQIVLFLSRASPIA